MVSEGLSTLGGDCSGDGDELPQFALVTLQQHCDKHALAPGAEGGAALCSLEEPSHGWFLAGFSTRLYRIDCDGCRERAAAVLTGMSEQGDQSQENGKHG
jgi:hypothetical protein